MNTYIKFIIWMFPVLFMTHDFEEIILVEAWKKRYSKELSSTTMKMIPFEPLRSTASFSIGILLEFVIIVLITMLSYWFNTYLIWFGVFFAFIFHFIGHIWMRFRFRSYVPGYFTSVIYLPISCYILFEVYKVLDYSFITIALVCVIETLVMFSFLLLLHRWMDRFYLWVEKYSSRGMQ